MYNMIIVPNRKKNGDYYKENGGKKSFSLESQSINIMHPYADNLVVVPKHKKNGYYYKNPSLSHFIDKL